MLGLVAAAVVASGLVVATVDVEAPRAQVPVPDLPPAPKAPVKLPSAPKAPAAPKAPVKLPSAPKPPVAPKAPVALPPVPKPPVAPQAPVALPPVPKPPVSVPAAPALPKPALPKPALPKPATPTLPGTPSVTSPGTTSKLPVAPVGTGLGAGGAGLPAVRRPSVRTSPSSRSGGQAGSRASSTGSPSHPSPGAASALAGGAARVVGAGAAPPADPVAARQIAAARQSGSSSSTALQGVLDRRGKRNPYRALSPRRLRRAVQRLQPCLPLLSRRERRVLRVRAGLNGGRPLSVRRAARRLGMSRRRLVRIEGRSLAKLRLASAAGACGGTGPKAAEAIDATAMLGGAGIGPGSASWLAQDVLGARRRGAAEASFVGSSVIQDRDTASGGLFDRKPLSSLSLDRVGSGLGSRELLLLLAGLGALVLTLVRVRRRI